MWKWENTKPPTQTSPEKRNFPTFQPHLGMICLALLALHPSVIHSTSQSIFVNALCHYSVPDLCSHELHAMAVTHMGSSPVPLEKPPPPSFHHTMFKWISLYKTYIFFFPISGHLEDRLCCLYLMKNQNCPHCAPFKSMESFVPDFNMDRIVPLFSSWAGAAIAELLPLKPQHQVKAYKSESFVH